MTTATATVTRVRSLPRLAEPLPARSQASDVLLLADRAARRFPAVSERVHRGALLLLAGHVEPLDPHCYGTRWFRVLSQSPARRRRAYTVNTARFTCECPDFLQGRAPEISGRRLCKHLFAALLWEVTRS